MISLEELLDQIRALPQALASVDHGADEDHVEDDVAAAVAELVISGTIAQAAQQSLDMRVKIARARGATWATIAKAVGTTEFRAGWRYHEKRPFGARW